jgi:hypothetical protein
LERISWFQQQVAQLRRTEKDPANYRAAASGFLAEIDRMQLEVREYFFVPFSGGAAVAEQNDAAALRQAIQVT